MILKKLFPVFVALFCATACIDNIVQLDEISEEAVIQRELAMPIINGKLAFEDIAGHGYDSLIFLQSGDTIFLYLNQDLGFLDTLQIEDLGNESMEFEFINIHHTVTNMFPIGIDLRIYLYDAEAGVNIDTIWFSGTPGELFLIAAPATADGLAIISEVETYDRYTALTNEMIDKIINQATNLVLHLDIPSTGGFIKILKPHRLLLHLGLEAKWQTAIDDTTGE